jgi:hypothetical protein
MPLPTPPIPPLLMFVTWQRYVNARVLGIKCSLLENDSQIAHLLA